MSTYHQPLPIDLKETLDTLDISMTEFSHIDPSVATQSLTEAVAMTTPHKRLSRQEAIEHNHLVAGLAQGGTICGSVLLSLCINNV